MKTHHEITLDLYDSDHYSQVWSVRCREEVRYVEVPRGSDPWYIVDLAVKMYEEE